MSYLSKLCLVGLIFCSARANADITCGSGSISYIWNRVNDNNDWAVRLADSYGNEETYVADKNLGLNFPAGRAAFAVILAAEANNQQVELLYSSKKGACPMKVGKSLKAARFDIVDTTFPSR